MLLSGCTYFGPGRYHRVEEGETFWSLSRNYDVKMEEIIKANKNIGDPGNIKKGQQVYIPGARRVHRSRKPKTGDRESGEEVEDLDFIWPVKGDVVQKFGQIDNKRHMGIGIKAMEGTPVAAAQDGKVIYVSDSFRSYGKIVIIEHKGEYSTVYAHNKENTVKEEEQVEKGDKIALVGSTGWASEPFLYFEIRYREKPRNPLYILP
ncbi:MAG: peptidoglycan DD-metalloendopeptidase family protein [Elusimicrobiota bacterium]